MTVLIIPPLVDAVFALLVLVTIVVFLIRFAVSELKKDEPESFYGKWKENKIGKR